MRRNKSQIYTNICYIFFILEKLLTNVVSKEIKNLGKFFSKNRVKQGLPLKIRKTVEKLEKIPTWQHGPKKRVCKFTMLTFLRTTFGSTFDPSQDMYPQKSRNFLTLSNYYYSTI